jgi:dTDP-4-amino-4,6-dideoxygalactose transaminase
MKDDEPWRDDYLVFGAPAPGAEEQGGHRLRLGPRVAEFERRLADYLAAPAVVAVNSCTAALHLALRVLDLPPGAEVITTAMTFCATANVIVHAGYEPVFADCDRATLNLDPDDVRRRLTPRTRAILPVHFAGRPCDLAALGRIAEEHGLAIVEDAAHALEATIDGRHCGTSGNFGCFSFYVTKPAPTPGTRHALHLFTCLVDDTRTSVTRDQVLTRLHALRIGAGVHYRAVHEHPFYRARYGARTGRLLNAEWMSARTFSLPLGGAMTDGDAADVVRALRHIFR